MKSFVQSVPPGCAAASADKPTSGADRLENLCEEAVALGTEGFRQTLGQKELPSQFALMLDHAPGAFAGYALMRAAVMREKDAGGALDLKTKSLIFVLLCIMADDIANAKPHLENAIHCGLTMPELAEALSQVLMVGGISRWNKGCAVLLEDAQRLCAARAADDPRQRSA